MFSHKTLEEPLKGLKGEFVHSRMYKFDMAINTSRVQGLSIEYPMYERTGARRFINVSRKPNFSNTEPGPVCLA